MYELIIYFVLKTIFFGENKNKGLKTAAWAEPASAADEENKDTARMAWAQRTCGGPRRSEDARRVQAKVTVTTRKHLQLLATNKQAEPVNMFYLGGEQVQMHRPNV